MNTKPKRKSLLDLIEELEKRITRLEKENRKRIEENKAKRQLSVEEQVFIAENKDS